MLRKPLKSKEKGKYGKKSRQRQVVRKSRQRQKQRTWGRDLLWERSPEDTEPLRKETGVSLVWVFPFSECVIKWMEWDGVGCMQHSHALFIGCADSELKGSSIIR